MLLNAKIIKFIKIIDFYLIGNQMGEKEFILIKKSSMYSSEYYTAFYAFCLKKDLLFI